MKGMQHKQAGFSIVEAIVVVAAIAIIGAAGWLVYQHNRTKLTGATANGTPSTTQNSTTSPTAATLDIKEWGVHIGLNSTTASLYYIIKPSLPDVAYFSIKTIAAVAPNCAADKYSL